MKTLWGSSSLHVLGVGVATIWWRWRTPKSVCVCVCVCVCVRALAIWDLVAMHKRESGHYHPPECVVGARLGETLAAVSAFAHKRIKYFEVLKVFLFLRVVVIESCVRTPRFASEKLLHLFCCNIDFSCRHLGPLDPCSLRLRENRSFMPGVARFHSAFHIVDINFWNCFLDCFWVDTTEQCTIERLAVSTLHFRVEDSDHSPNVCDDASTESLPF